MSEEKNGVRISLTEPVVFLRGADTAHRHRRNEDDDPVGEGAPLRGLLTLTLTKPTRIRSIEVELQCKTSTTWPEGMGARRIDVVEDHTVFSAHAVYFDACTDPQITTNPRRGLSTGPGIQLDADHIPPRRGRSSRPVSPSGPSQRHASTDRTNFHRTAPTLTYHEPVPPTPPYTPSAEPSAAWPQSPTILPTTLSGSATPIYSDETRDRDPLHILEHSRHVLLGHLEQANIDAPPSVRRRSMTPANIAGATSPPIQSSASSVRSAGPSRRESSDEDGPPPSSPPINQPSSPSPASSSRHIPTLSAVRSQSTSVTPSSSKARVPTPSADTERGERGGSGSRTRFSIASVVDVFRHKSRRTHSPDAMPIDECDSPSPSRERSQAEGERGRPRQKATFSLNDEPEDHHDDSHNQKHDHHRQNWKEFRKGTYTYPILFTLPRTCPASLHATHGSVQWRLRATAHRPGAFNPALRAEKPVQVVAAPGEADTEESESIVVERAWDDQLQYILSVSGRAFPIGGNIPLQIVFMPLDKVKVHRVVVYMDEKLEYMTAMSRVVRADPLRRHLLLSLRGPEEGIPLLPLPSGDFDLASSTLGPLFPLSSKPDSELTDTDREALSETVASLSGPGPWSLDMNVTLPTCEPHSALGPLRPSNKNKRANVLVTHSLRVLMRVERGDDKAVDAKGKRKMFDIVVCSPVHLFSCLCSPESAILPRYGADPGDVGPRTVADGSFCGCAITSARGAASTTATISPPRPTMPPRRISGSHASGSAGLADSQAWRYERLVAGQEAESGERPPEYGEVVAGRA